MIYLLAISTQRTLDLTHSLDTQLEPVVERCLAGRSHTASQELAAIWIKEGIESVVFPSATGTGKNVVVYLENASGSSVMVRNRDEILKAFRGHLLSRKKSIVAPRSSTTIPTLSIRLSAMCPIYKVSFSLAMDQFRDAPWTSRPYHALCADVVVRFTRRF
jgi:hypothetical protein